MLEVGGSHEEEVDEDHPRNQRDVDVHVKV